MRRAALVRPVRTLDELPAGFVAFASAALNLDASRTDLASVLASVGACDAVLARELAAALAAIDAARCRARVLAEDAHTRGE